MKIKLLFVLLLGITLEANSYPISPRPLSLLILESEYIVYAYVEDIEKVDTSDFWFQTNAVLNIKEVLQGDLKETNIRVAFTPGMVCPAPAHYDSGTFVVAFLYKHEGVFRTQALSYGSKEVTEEDYLVLKSRIQEMHGILGIQKKKVQKQAHVDWLVRCATQRITRWDGVYELSPHSDLMHYYNRHASMQDRESKISDEQKDTLRKVFLSLERISRTDLMMLDLISKPHDFDILYFLFQYSQTLDFESMRMYDFYYVSMIFEQIVEMTNRSDLESLLGKLEKLDHFDEDDKEKAVDLSRRFMTGFEEYISER